MDCVGYVVLPPLFKDIVNIANTLKLFTPPKRQLINNKPLDRANTIGKRKLFR